MGIHFIFNSKHKKKNNNIQIDKGLPITRGIFDAVVCATGKGLPNMEGKTLQICWNKKKGPLLGRSPSDRQSGVVQITASKNLKSVNRHLSAHLIPETSFLQFKINFYTDIWYIVLY